LLAYEKNIANRPLYWKDIFENSIRTKEIIPQKVAPKIFTEKVRDTFNQAPVISSIE